MSITSARPVLPKSLMLAGVATVALHVLCAVALGRAGWAGQGWSSRLVTAVRGGSDVAASPVGAAGLHVRLAHVASPIAPTSELSSTMVGGTLPDSAQRTGVDEAENLLNATAPAAGGSASLATSYLSAEEVDRGPTPEPGWVLDEAALERVGPAHMRLRLWVSERGRIDRVALIHAEPAGAWVERVIRPLADTRMLPAERHGQPVASIIVVELRADLETMR